MKDLYGRVAAHYGLTRQQAKLRCYALCYGARVDAGLERLIRDYLAGTPR